MVGLSDEWLIVKAGLVPAGIQVIRLKSLRKQVHFMEPALGDKIRILLEMYPGNPLLPGFCKRGFRRVI
jgi:hypothetical protein